MTTYKKQSEASDSLQSSASLTKINTDVPLAYAEDLAMANGKDLETAINEAAQSGGSTVALDDNVTKDSANGVKSSGIYTAINTSASSTTSAIMAEVSKIQTDLAGKVKQIKLNATEYNPNSGIVTIPMRSVDGYQLFGSDDNIPLSIKEVDEGEDPAADSSTYDNLSADTYVKMTNITALYVELEEPSANDHIAQYWLKVTCKEIIDVTTGELSTTPLPYSILTSDGTTAVTWINDNNLILMPGKAYEICIVNNVGMWAVSK